MEQEKSKLVVLACIPNLKGGRSGSAGHVTFPNEEGRLISQTVAFRLLAATIVLLLVVAIIPFSAGKSDPKPAATTASSTPSPTPAATDLPWQPNTPRVPQKAVEESAQMSVWPSPNRPIASQIEERPEGLPSPSNQPTAVRSTQYKADARTGF
jgi:hypothetical protein